mgnify:FL=1
MLRSGLIIFFFTIACTSCWKKTTSKKPSSDTNKVLPSNTGNVSELVLVISDELWSGKAGEIISDILQENIKAIPQQEALFDIYNIEARDFSSIYKTHKNILWISSSENEAFERVDQMWSKDQLYIRLSNTTEEALINNLKDHIYTIRSWFVDKDQQRRLQKLKTSADKEIQKQLQRSYELSITIPKGYQIASSEDNFIWLRKDSPKVNVVSNIWIHSEAYHSPEQFNKKNLIALRDSIGKTHVEGSRPQSFMATEMLYDPDYKLIKKEPYTIETKGLWTMINDFLGGSYTAYVILDEEKQRIIYAEGFIYCPGERKRAHIFELEAILSGLELN